MRVAFISSVAHYKSFNLTCLIFIWMQIFVAHLPLFSLLQNWLGTLKCVKDENQKVVLWSGCLNKWMWKWKRNIEIICFFFPSFTRLYKYTCYHIQRWLMSLFNAIQQINTVFAFFFSLSRLYASSICVYVRVCGEPNFQKVGFFSCSLFFHHIYSKWSLNCVLWSWLRLCLQFAIQ